MALQTRKLDLRCPTCKSANVVYSCEPLCCFCHVCADCMTTFHTASVELEGRLEDAVAPPGDPPASDEPVVQCVVCESIAVHAAEDGGLVCTDCGQLLALEIQDVTPRAG